MREKAQKLIQKKLVDIFLPESVKMRTMSIAEALREGLAEEMRKDKDVFLIGEDIGLFGGSFQVTKGLLDEFGPERVRGRQP